MPDWKGKTRGGVLGNLFFIYLIKYLGINSAYFFLRIVAVYFLIFSNKKYIYSFYRRILQFTPWKSIRFIYKNYCKLGEILVDKFALLSGAKTRFSFNFDGEEHLRNMKNGGILISAHLGSWEIAGQLLERLDLAFNVVMFDAEHEKIKNHIDPMLTKKNFRIIVIKEDMSHIYEIRQALERKELVCLHGDRFVENSKTVLKQFLGEEARFPAGPFYLVSRFEAPVSFVFALKESSSHYHFFATRAKTYKFSKKYKDRDANLNLVLEDYLIEFQEKVHLYPEQWFNYHKFWSEADDK